MQAAWIPACAGMTEGANTVDWIILSHLISGSLKALFC